MNKNKPILTLNMEDKIYLAAARVYHDTIEQLVEINENNVKYKDTFKANDVLIENFMSHQK